jgi:hypothetical protein
MSAIAILPLGPNVDAVSIAAMVAVGMVAYWRGLKVGALVGDSWKR